MPTFRHESLVQAPVERVWSLLSTVTEWPRWLSTVTALAPLDGTALAVGARFRLVQPRLRPSVWTVTQVQPPYRFDWECRSPGLRAVACHVLDARPGPCTHIALRMDFHGPLSPIVGMLAGRMVRDYLAREAQELACAAQLPPAAGDA